MSDQALAFNDIGDVEVSISSARVTVAGWTGLQVIRAIDSCADGFAFSFPWEATDTNRQRFVAFRTSVIEMRHKGERFLRGRMEKLSFDFSSTSRMATMEGRGDTGVLLDLSAPPIELSSSFNTIARQICPSATVVRAVPDIMDLNVQIEIGQTPFEVLSTIAAGYGYWPQPQTDGSLTFSKISPRSPSVATIREGEAPVIDIQTSHDLTRRFHRYTAISTEDGDDSVAEAIDEGVDPRFRDGMIIQSQRGGNVSEAAAFARSRGIMDAYTCRVTVAGWTHHGRLWAPADIVTVFAPSVMIYREYNLIVNRVTMQLDENGGAVTELDLTFPQLFSGGDPGFPYPWSIEGDA